MSDLVISFENVSFSYGGVTALKDVTFSVKEREFVAVIGPNGGGKTTLLKLVAGLLSPQKGVVRVLGGPAGAARRCIGYVPQYFPFDPHFPLSVNDVVLLGRLRGSRPFWWPSRRDREAVGEALSEVGLRGARRKPFASLSGGERQRVLIARALAGDPKILLLDEPLAHVDPRMVDSLYALFRALSDRLTVVLVSHDVGFVATSVRRVICVNRSVVVHPTGRVPPEVFSELYGTSVHVVRHDITGEGGRGCPRS